MSKRRSSSNALVPILEKEQQNIIGVVLSKEVVPIDERIAQRAGRLHGELYNDGTPVDMHDCLIVATSIDFEEPVVTRNVDHFERIDDVQVVDWNAF
ncbi:PIN domain-containing protein [Halalkalicoccus ordinarius]|uniref:type II toxin-antitoxin system VapC family toxin n=1 Tax=Halalkalicoccus ordinarius TaxID=3116651 RepID=UPI00300F0F69